MWLIVNGEKRWKIGWLRKVPLRFHQNSIRAQDHVGQPPGTNQAGPDKFKQTSVDTSLIISVPYCASTKACESKKSETEKMLELEVIDLEQTEWASPIVSVPE